jgi:integrase
MLASRELRTWRDGLLATLKPSSVNRLCKPLRAALVLAAQHNRRITNRDAWGTGLETLPDAYEPRNVVLSDAKVYEFVNAAYQYDAKLGLLCDTLAVTGARPSQATRLVVADLHGGAKPKLMMPKSGKGGGRNRIQRKSERYSVPITPALAAKLKQAAKGRAADAPLLLQADGRPWSKSPSNDYHEDVREIVKSIGLDPDVVTVYTLRHSSVVRMLLKNVPVRLVASLHNTSVAEVERTYSRFITEFSDDIARDALLQPDLPSAPVADNVVALAN